MSTVNERILVGRPMVRRRVVGDGWYAAVRYTNGVAAVYAETRIEAMEAGRKAVREAVFCRCSPFGPIYMRSLADPARLVPVHGGGDPSPKMIEVRLR